MNEKDVLISHVLDLKEKSADESVITTTNFLSADELSDVIKKERYYNEFTDTFYYGGYSDAERKVVVFIPKFYSLTESDLEDFLNENASNPITILKIVKDRFAKLSHRDYLGALMGLGIKREFLGDIVVTEEGCTLFCLNNIADFIINNLKQAGRGQLSITKCDPEDFIQIESKTETVFVSVASMRLDCLVAAAFKTSRNLAVGLITQGLVFVNSEQITKTDFLLSEGDKLVLRGKGKVLLEELTGESKKGRLHINIKKYI